MDILFILRASVGLIVRAPSPVAWPGIIDSLLPEDGVLAPYKLSRAGDRPALAGVVAHGLSGAFGEAVGPEKFRPGCMDFLFMALAAVDRPKSLETRSVSAAFPWEAPSARVGLAKTMDRVCSFLFGRAVLRSGGSRPSGWKNPGPTDFLELRTALLLASPAWK